MRQLDAVTLWPPRTPLRRVVTAVVGLLAVSGVGVLDSATGSGLSFAAFYMVVIVMTAMAGADVGIMVVAFSTAVWCAVSVLTGRSDASVALLVLNGIVFVGAQVILVLLVATVLRALQAARESEARSRAFLANAAHQLRTPVAALAASVEALHLDGPHRTRERLLANATDEARRLGSLVAALLRIARLDQGDLPRPEPTDPIALCENELERARQLSPLQWQLDVAGDIPHEMVLDPRATSESLWNLLDNAGRHAAATVAVSLRVDRTRLVIEVADDGPGLPGGAESRAFDRFVTLDGQGGTGLGLAIARDLARSQGGEVTYVGNAFVLALPRSDARPTVERTRRRGREALNLLGGIEPLGKPALPAARRRWSHQPSPPRRT